MRLRRFVCAALVAVMAAGSTQSVDAYYDDTHYSLTYYIARSCGYTPMQAHRVASADVGVDYSALSEPEQIGRIFFPRETAHETRVRFHAIWDERTTTVPTPESRLAFTKGRRLEWLTAVIPQRNPGVMLHFLQDEEPHRGYSSWGGHWAPSPSEVAAAEIKLPFGPTTDFLSSDQGHSLKMVDETVDALTKFMGTMKTRQRRGGASCSTVAIIPVLRELMRVNPVSTSAKVYSELVAKMLSLRVLETTSLAAAALAAKLNAPAVAKADEVIMAALNRELPQYPYKGFNERLPYTYDDKGAASKPDEITLYGTVDARVSGAAGQKVGVSIWAAPTRLGERPYQISECRESSYRFENLPVGDLIVQTVAGGKITRTPFHLDRSQKTFELNLAASKKDAQPNKCSNDAAEMAAKACEAAASNPGGDLNQPRPAEQQLEQKLDECKQEEEKQKTDEQTRAETQPTQPTTPASGPSMGKILGWSSVFGVAIAGGAYVAQQAAALADDSYTTTTSTTTTPSNQQPTGNINSGSTVTGFQITCTLSAAGTFRNCTGFITATIGPSVTAGVPLTAATVRDRSSAGSRHPPQGPDNR